MFINIFSLGLLKKGKNVASGFFFVLNCKSRLYHFIYLYVDSLVIFANMLSCSRHQTVRPSITNSQNMQENNVVQ